MKKLFKKQTQKLLNWLASTKYFGPPRLWTNKEWSSFSSKEKVWVVYKHHDNLIGTGNSELDRFLPFMKGEFITSVAAVSSFLILIKAPEWVLLVYPVVYMSIWKYLQWWVGNEIDKRDLIALQSEIGKKRELAMREVRQALKKEEWRKAKVNQ